MSNYSIYMLESPNGKRYIGMTMRKPEYRWNYGKGYKSNKSLYADIQRFGWENIKKVILVFTPSKESAELLERFYIDLYDTRNPLRGYNIEMGGVPTSLAKQTKKKMSDAHKGKERSEEYRRHISESKRGAANGMFGKVGDEHPNSSGVIAIDDSGATRRYGSMSIACKELNLSKNAFKNISACCMGKRKSAYGYRWRYADGK